MKQIAFLWFMITSNYAIAQVIHKKIEAYRTEISPIIDGVIEPELWSHLPKAKNWSQLEPINGEPERLNQKSEVQFMYNDRALYIQCLKYFVIFPEEKYLEDKFGDIYVRYKKSVNRWI